MSLDKAIESGKEKRKQYRKSKVFDRSCRNHGSCGYCEDNRAYRSKRLIEACDDELNSMCDDELAEDELTFYEIAKLNLFLDKDYHDLCDCSFEELTSLMS